ncbi:MAG TPA: hypothetical protein PK765_03540 [bacterium]|nr:hypothetical protein [bacterium]
MECLETTDLEYRVYWTKKNGVAEIFQVHGKERKQGHVLHNIAQGNTLRFFELSDIPQGLIEKIRDYCSAIPDSHGGLDVLESTDGRFFFTENNVMPGYFDSE